MSLQSKSISANGSKGHHKFTLNITENSTNLMDNTSSVSWSLVLSPIHTSWDWNYSATVPVTYSVTINGSTYSGNIMKYDGSSTVTVASGTLSIAHNTDGNKSISYSFSISSLNYSYLPGSASASGSMDLTFIARKSVPTVSVSSIEFGKSITINTNRKSSNFTHRLYYKYNSVSWIEITSSASVGASYTWTAPLTLMNQIPNASSLYITICCSTYYDSNWIGEDYAYFTATVPTTSDCYPTIGGISWTKTSSEPSTWPITQNVSKGTMTMTGVSGAYGSTIKSYSLTFAGLSSTSASLTVSNIASSGTLKAVATVTDSRSRSFTKEVSFNVTAYSKPVLTTKVYRSDASGTEDASGDYMYVKASVTITSVGNNSLQSLVLQYKKHTDSVYTSVTLTSDIAQIVAVSSDYTWDWIITATDRIYPVSDSNFISTADVVLDILANGKGIAMGKVSEQGDLLDVAWSGRVRKNLTVDGTLTVSGKTLDTMIGATDTEAGSSGTVPVPDAGEQDKVLHGDGTWRTPESTFTADITPVSVKAPTAVNLTADKIFYYVSSDMENISVTYDSLPNGWVGFLTIYNIMGASFSSDVMATKSINGVAQSAVGNISGCINIALFKYGGSNKLQWFVFKS